MRRLLLLALLVPLAAGCGWFNLGRKRLHELAVFLEASKGLR